MALSASHLVWGGLSLHCVEASLGCRCPVPVLRWTLDATVDVFWTGCQAGRWRPVSHMKAARTQRPPPRYTVFYPFPKLTLYLAELQKYEVLMMTESRKYGHMNLYCMSQQTSLNVASALILIPKQRSLLNCDYSLCFGSRYLQTLNWTGHTTQMHWPGGDGLFFLRRLRTWRVQGALLQTFIGSVTESTGAVAAHL